MNKHYGVILALVFLFGLGVFNFALGVQGIRKRRKSTAWGVFRLLLSIPFIVLPFIIFYYLKKLGQF